MPVSSVFSLLTVARSAYGDILAVARSAYGDILVPLVFVASAPPYRAASFDISSAQRAQAVPSRSARGLTRLTRACVVAARSARGLARLTRLMRAGSVCAGGFWPLPLRPPLESGTLFLSRWSAGPAHAGQVACSSPRARVAPWRLRLEGRFWRVVCLGHNRSSVASRSLLPCLKESAQVVLALALFWPSAIRVSLFASSRRVKRPECCVRNPVYTRRPPSTVYGIIVEYGLPPWTGVFGSFAIRLSGFSILA